MKKKYLAAALALSLAILALIAPTNVTPAQAATPPSVKVVDSANTITDPAWFTQAYSEGIRLYVMHSTAWGSCAPWEHTQAQLKMALDAGLKIAVYTRDATCWQGGIAAAGPYQSQLQFFALDVETGSPPVTRAMVDGVRAMGVRPVIYSGSGMWPSIMNNSSDFADVPLWDTNAGAVNYSGWVADTGAPAMVAYGGWNTAANPRIGVQQKFEHNLNGVLVDLNSFDAAFLGAPAPVVVTPTPTATPSPTATPTPTPTATPTPAPTPAPAKVRIRHRR
ncbi:MULTISPECIES: hypothetical protein [unclassified Cryobacterium]|uniref:hypothetical protein n=1 Tax=unclassified Cryobacterium TaxID=2649013 RepID=UPI002AB5997A|nr:MULTISPECIES: hypothetical protein [unclassified Cryobacterium]MDY7541640.1 hypothetical protein [Cryobacterium sp. 5B3]MEA9999020.1 hypothetical protein [Cryobacterium sp. RTS3]MEB0267219.1 hypothetical protein [Cryobacterium sp. 10I5]MEB0275413.1 hypothetical protein [Cryobacterium sp. 5B3]